ncbi:phosphoribosylformylglycinamidine cyclo-ligase [Alkalihalobacillus sp. LMS39]|uniref:phosphoribosylformylglycinamidine cyclo-ligase n=1 Tax=Alkalihalobacillus sp. LMS39 TaxID=2924032 RepID=UPI001FB1ECEE|nr:phosphoribosylformylglycinamidine cyclo-ligase [Alkalihalobacillus sp. LMS39]UOE94483.1 phosphoribosylformylglycinamidine cyclo-ligase [Alkalihalobacillus sp. LMS39]
MSEAYKRAGVDIEAGYEAVERMKKHVARTKRPEVLGGLGSFGGMFDLSQFNLKEPVLISGTDGVGTKLMLVFMMDKHDTIGVDAVAMCVNDIIAQGAEPLYFLDYIACGKAVPEKIEAIVKGLADGCQQAGCAIVGGETAEMPGMYSEEEYDLAGFTVGIVEKSKLITGEHIKEGDVIIGLQSNGVHSNGFSLVRKVLLEENQLQLQETYDGFSQSLGAELLTPTRIYVKPLLKVLEKFEVKGISHITGGGFYENIPRMLPEQVGADIQFGTWTIPPIFSFIEEKGSISKKDMFSTFNMGIGMALVVSEQDAKQVIAELESHGETAFAIGRVKQGEGVSIGGIS